MKCEDPDFIEKARQFITKAKKMHAGLILTPEYSFSYGILDEIIDDKNKWPEAEKLWCLETQRESRDRFGQKLSDGRRKKMLSLLIKHEDGDRLIAIRGVDNKPIRIFQMSMGQRTFLALAVLFTLHLSALKAPKFLTLDEPVANMDDFHLMNLIDILGELALQGIQIIFTTMDKIRLLPDYLDVNLVFSLKPLIILNSQGQTMKLRV